MKGTLVKKKEPFDWPASTRDSKPAMGSTKMVTSEEQ